jgi:DNA-binding LacI/PurR family transcriptional regulator
LAETGARNTRVKATVTLSDVAAAARVSKATASNVYSRPERVRPALRERVAEAARMLGYDGPDPRGRLLSSGKVNAIGVVPPAAFGISLFFKNTWTNTFLSGIAGVCEERGVGLSLVSGRDDQVAGGLESAVVDGLILSNADQIEFITPSRRRNMPIAVFGRAPAGISSVRVADRAGARLMAEHLLALGHRRFVIGGPLNEFRAPVFHLPGRNRLLVSPLLDTDDRLAGIADAFAGVGLSLDAMPLMEACCTPVEEAAFGSGADVLLDHIGDATAVIALADSVALAVMAKARARGISVPGDLSVVGFDGIPEGASSTPPLTTMAQPIAEIGATAARLVLDGGEPRHVVLSGNLVVRGSTAKPRR